MKKLNLFNKNTVSFAENRFVFFAGGLSKNPEGPRNTTEAQPLPIDVNMDELLRNAGTEVVKGSKDKMSQLHIRQLKDKITQYIDKGVKSIPGLSNAQRAEKAYQLEDRLTAETNKILSSKSPKRFEECKNYLEEISDKLVNLGKSGKLDYANIDNAFATKIKMEGMTIDADKIRKLDKQAKITLGLEKNNSRLLTFAKRIKAKYQALGLSPRDAKAGALNIVKSAQYIYANGGLDQMNNYLKEIQQELAKSKRRGENGSEAVNRIAELNNQYM